MAIAVMIKRKVKQGYQAKQLVPFILQLRALATFQPGYISGVRRYAILNNQKSGW